MAIKTYKKTILLKGSKGDTGENENDTTAPIGAMFYIDDDAEIPEGYEARET